LGNFRSIFFRNPPPITHVFPTFFEQFYTFFHIFAKKPEFPLKYDGYDKITNFSGLFGFDCSLTYPVKQSLASHNRFPFLRVRQDVAGALDPSGTTL